MLVVINCTVSVRWKLNGHWSKYHVSFDGVDCLCGKKIPVDRSVEMEIDSIGELNCNGCHYSFYGLRQQLKRIITIRSEL